MADMLGYLAPGVGIAKGVRGTKLGAQGLTQGISKRNMGQFAKEGATVGALMSGGEVAGREALNPEDYNWKQNLGQIAIETGAGAALDPLVSVLGPLAKMGADRSIRSAVNSSNQDLISRMTQGVGDIPTIPSPLDDLLPANRLDRLMQEANKTRLEVPRLDIPDTRAQGDQALAEYNQAMQQAQNLATQTRQSNTNPLGLTDYEPNFTLRDENQLRLEAPKQENYPSVYRPDAPLEEKLAYWKNPEMARTDTDVREIMKEMERIEADIRQFNERLPELRNVEVSKEPVVESIRNSGERLLDESMRADESWAAAKQIKEQFKDPKNRPEWAKFSIPKELRKQDEFKDIPTRFIAKGKDENYGTDYAKAMDLAGFEYFDDFVDHLRFIDQQLRTTRKSMSTLGIKESKDLSKEMGKLDKQFEQGLRQQFGIDELEHQLDELSSLATPYEPPIAEPMNPLAFKTTQRQEVPRNPITEILYPNNQYGVERAATNTPRMDAEAAATTAINEPSVRAESLAPVGSAPEPKMVRVKQQERVAQQATDVVIEQPEALRTIISRGTSEADMQAQKIIKATTKNPVLRVARTFRQQMVGSKNNATYAEKHLLKQEIPKVQERLKNATSEAERSSLQYELDDLTRRMKATKDTSYTQMALENEMGADIKATNLANDFVKKLNSIEGATLEEMANWQLAKRINWLHTSPDNVNKKAIPESWARFSEETLANGQGNPAFEQSEAIFRELQETRLNLVRQQKSEAEIEALLREPYYVPMYLDKSYKVARGNESGKGLKGFRSTPRPTSSEIDTIKEFGKDEVAGSPSEFVNNPIESIIGDLFREQRSIARNDTAQQFRKLSQMDDLGTFVTEVDERLYQANSDKYLKGYENGEPFYLEIHPEFRKMLQENDSVEGVDPIQIATTVMSRLKTTSPEYLMTAIPRDLMTGFMNSETKNPFKYAGQLWKALTDESYKRTGLDAGVQYRNAYDPQSAAQQSSEALQKQIREMAGFTDVDATNIEKSTSMISKAFDKLTTPMRKIGQVTDDLPRIVEANTVKQRWEKNILSKTRAQITELEQRMANAPQDEFVEGNVGQLQSQLEQLHQRLDMETRGMEREMTHRGRDVMPYQRSGENFLSKKLFKKYFNFANTTTQAKDKFARTFTRDPIGTSIKALGLSAPFPIIIGKMYDGLSPEEQQEYDAIPDYLKQQRYIFPLGNGEFVTMPKVQELAILSNFADADAGVISYEGAMQYAVKETTPFQLGGFTSAFTKGGEEPRTTTEFMEDVVLPTTAATPIIDMALNRKTSFNGKPVSYNREGQADEWTKDIFADMFRGTDTANFAQYGVQQMGGDYAKYTTALLDMIYGPSSEDNQQGLRDLNPLQDYLYSPSRPGFKEMFYDKDKLPK